MNRVRSTFSGPRRALSHVAPTRAPHARAVPDTSHCARLTRPILAWAARFPHNGSLVVRAGTAFPEQPIAMGDYEALYHQERKLRMEAERQVAALRETIAALMEARAQHGMPPMQMPSMPPPPQPPQQPQPPARPPSMPMQPKVQPAPAAPPQRPAPAAAPAAPLGSPDEIRQALRMAVMRGDAAGLQAAVAAADAAGLADAASHGRRKLDQMR